MITPKQRELRRKHLQASDFGPILGLSPWAGPVDIALSKKYETTDTAPTPQMEKGNWLEKPLVHYCAKRVGVKPVFRNLFRIEPDPGIIGCNADAFVENKPVGIDAKYSTVDEGWGQDGEAIIPQTIFVQLQVQMYVCQWERVYCVRADRDLNRSIHPIDRDDTVIGELVEFGHRWWRDHVVADVLPDGEPVDLDSIKRIVREPAKMVEIPILLMDAWQVAKDARLAAEKREDLTMAALLAEMGDAELADYGDADEILHYAEQNSAPKVNHAQMRADGVWEKYCVAGTHRVLRFKKRSK